jgi:rare lipoprotein A
MALSVSVFASVQARPDPNRPAPLACTIISLIVTTLMGALLSGCVGVATEIPTGAGPDRAPTLTQSQRDRLAQAPDPVVTALPKSKTGNPDQYEVWGKTYRVSDSAEGYKAEGMASWYGAKFHGRRTSSGEGFNMYRLTAAHRSLPIPVFARVTNLQNGRSTVVKINDRGPFHENRIIDLSYAAAVKLGFEDAGTARVRVETLTESAQPVPLATGDDARYYHAGSFETAEEARQALQQMLSLEAVSGQVVVRPSGDFALRFGPVNSSAKSERLRALLLTLDIGLPKLVIGR